MQKNNYDELLSLIKTKSGEELKDYFGDYHESDIADVLEKLEPEERLRIYKCLGKEYIAEIFTFYNDKPKYINELDSEYAADILELMDSDEAFEILDELPDEEKTSILTLMDEESKKNVRKIFKYEDDEIGSYLTDNFIVIKATSSISAAMKQMIASAGEHDNIFTIFAVDDDNKYVGAIDLKDLIISRKDANLDDLIMRSYPSFYGDQKMEDCIDLLKDYNEDLIPILNRNNMIDGAITIQSVMDASEEEMEKDYAMLGGLSEDDDIDESIFSSIKKRIPWLIILLFLGIIVSSVIGVFEAVIATLPVVVFFQSMILDMAGNAGTQSLAVTIRNIGDEGFINDRKKRRRGILKEIKLGLLNGLIIGTIAFIFVFIYLIITKKEISSGLGFNIIETLKVSGIISFSMFISITISSMIGTLFPLFLEKIHIDPAVASGPFITTINDIVSVAIYYGLIYIFFILLL